MPDRTSPCYLFIASISAQLSRGADPQVVLGDLLELVESDNNSLDPSDLGLSIGLLARRGAIVASADPGCALERLINKYPRPRSHFIGCVCDAILSCPDQLPFHVLARHFVPDLWGISRTGDIPGAWLPALRARDPLGRTVSHHLWSNLRQVLTEGEANLISQGPITQAQLDEYRYLHTKSVWLFQDMLGRAGLGLDAIDTSGTSILDLCLQRLRDGTIDLLPEYGPCHQVQAALARRALDQQTPPLARAPVNPRL